MDRTPVPTARRLIAPFFVLSSLLLVCFSQAVIASTAETERYRGGLNPEPAVTVSEIYRGSYALVIGVSDYVQDWEDLPGVGEDVNAVAELLERSGFDEVARLSNPGKAELQAGIETFIAAHGRQFDNRLLIYFAGHGLTLTLNDGRVLGFIIPADVPFAKPSDGPNYAVSMQWIEQQALAIEAKHVLFMFDSCYSGSVFRSMRGMPTVTPAIASLASKPVRQFIAAGTEGQLVPDESVFRKWFEAALSGSGDSNHDGFITGTELGIFLRHHVSNETDAAQTPQFARMLREGFADGDFIFESPIAPVEMESATQLLEGADGQDRAPGIGTRFRDCRECPEMTAIPSGRFLMGSPASEPERASDELRQEERTIDRPFAMSVFEITTEQWNSCFSEGVCLNWRPVPVDGGPREPVHGVTRQDAQQFATWMREKTGLDYRLPTEAEWEYAARAGTVSARPWGEHIDVNRANCAGCGSGYDGRRLAPVGSFDANRFGLFDMLGNVWEWVDSCLDADGATPKEAGAGSPDSGCSMGVLKGGSYVTAPRGVRSASRGQYPADKAQVNFGFRIARDLN